MAQGKYKKLITKKARKGFKGHPIATVPYYGPTDKVATKLVCGIIKSENSEPEPMQKWFSDGDIRKSESVSRELVTFIEANQAKSVAMVDGILGCPHEEGIDYPYGESCPECPFWANHDRWTGKSTY